MLLDDYLSFPQLDTLGLIAQIDGLPNQILDAWEFGLAQALPDWKAIHNILIAGIGGSAIGADLLSAFISAQCPVPFVVHRDYDLPAWAKDSHTLVIGSSFSGNTKETLAVLDEALSRGCTCLAIAAGGKLEALSKEKGIPLWKFSHCGPPRATIGYSFALLLAVVFRLGLIPDPTSDLFNTIETLRKVQTNLRCEIPVVRNPAKRLAGQLVNRCVLIIGSGILAPVARRWKTQVNELAKAWSEFDFLPEVDHNTLAGTQNPVHLIPQLYALFLRADCDDSRNRTRSDLTRKEFLLQGICTEHIDAFGDTPLANLWTMVHFGDYLTYYLAMAYGVDPTPIDAIENFKREMEAIHGK